MQIKLKKMSKKEELSKKVFYSQILWVTAGDFGFHIKVICSRWARIALNEQDSQNAINRNAHFYISGWYQIERIEIDDNDIDHDTGFSISFPLTTEYTKDLTPYIKHTLWCYLSKVNKLPPKNERRNKVYLKELIEKITEQLIDFLNKEKIRYYSYILETEIVKNKENVLLRVYRKLKRFIRV